MATPPVPPGSAQVNPAVTVIGATTTGATLSWSATAPSYRIQKLVADNYGQLWTDIASGYTDTSYPVDLANVDCEQFKVYAEPFVGDASPVTACATIPVQAVYTLPDPNVTVSLASDVTAVTLRWRTADQVIHYKTYTAASQFVYLSECSKPDSSSYRCDVMTESGVTLVAADGSTVTVDITAQFAADYVASGHPWWRQSQIVLNGTVTSN
jgi:hypothetical protein